jgi:hypothetical protein
LATERRLGYTPASTENAHHIMFGNHVKTEIRFR